MAENWTKVQKQATAKQAVCTGEKTSYFSMEKKKCFLKKGKIYNNWTTTRTNIEFVLMHNLHLIIRHGAQGFKKNGGALVLRFCVENSSKPLGQSNTVLLFLNTDSTKRREKRKK
jgi:hypothetical protein